MFFTYIYHKSVHQLNISNKLQYFNIKMGRCILSEAFESRLSLSFSFTVRNVLLNYLCCFIIWYKLATSSTWHLCNMCVARTLNAPQKPMPRVNTQCMLVWFDECTSVYCHHSILSVWFIILTNLTSFVDGLIYKIFQSCCGLFTTQHCLYNETERIIVTCMQHNILAIWFTAMHS